MALSFYNKDFSFDHLFVGRYIGTLGISSYCVFENTPIANTFFNFELNSNVDELELGKLYVLFSTGSNEHGIAKGRLLSEKEMNYDEVKNIVSIVLKYEDKLKVSK